MYWRHVLAIRVALAVVAAGVDYSGKSLYRLTDPGVQRSGENKPVRRLKKIIKGGSIPAATPTVASPNDPDGAERRDSEGGGDTNGNILLNRCCAGSSLFRLACRDEGERTLHGMSARTAGTGFGDQ